MGHAFSAQDEYDQALSTYRTASRIFKNSPIPVICLGMEYMGSGDLALAEELFRSKYDSCRDDPWFLGEYGALLFKRNDYPTALDVLQQADEIVSARALDPRAWHSLYLNLGHVFSKSGKFDKALTYFEKALIYCPVEQQHEVHSCIALVFMYKSQVDDALDHLQKALSIQPTDQVCNRLLTIALTEYGSE
eukprot:TRINITY_DN34079_c0_g2_i1.p1 TRINITY_DN34079_c0_g2~~TRINITY_DN34079_c0_g2_i1.p1  ORF type:complete len:191 (-),score=26.72 TRINITY_DN34079_c0_g2_i1:51-623(-)